MLCTLRACYCPQNTRRIFKYINTPVCHMWSFAAGCHFICNWTIFPPPPKKTPLPLPPSPEKNNNNKQTNKKQKQKQQNNKNKTAPYKQQPQPTNKQKRKKIPTYFHKRLQGGVHSYMACAYNCARLLVNALWNLSGKSFAERSKNCSQPPISRKKSLKN